MDHFDVLIVGGGHGGAQSAIALRQLGFTGSIAIATAEPELPYERPPLSKDYLLGEKERERLLIRPATFWLEREVAVLIGCKVVRVDAERRCVITDANGEIGYRTLIWAAGGSARRISCGGSDLQEVYTIRCLADADALRAKLPGCQKAVVVGGGYIGLEAAAALNKRGKDVVLLEAGARVLNRVAGEPISRFYEAEHRARGVDIRLQTTVEAILGRNDRVAGVLLSDGSEVAADLVVVGIGIDAEVEPLVAAGAAHQGGVLVDEFCRTSLPDIYAVGDCAAHANRFAGGAVIRLESVQNATDQANTAASAITGAPLPYDAVPWFWSNQYDLKLQSVGLSHGHDAVLVRGRPEARSFSVIYLRESRVVALDCVNAVKDYVQGRKLVLDGATPPPQRLADPAVPLKNAA